VPRVVPRGEHPVVPRVVPRGTPAHEVSGD
jgi:hypothetical protein